MRRRKTLTEKERRFHFEAADDQPIEWKDIFPRSAAVEIDLGCGDGTFLTAMAELYPERNFLGIERLAGRSSAACRKAALLSRENVRVWQTELSHIARLSAASVAGCHLLFPDPWPKRRHWHRRTFNSHFLEGIARLLRRDGYLHLATDHAEYFSEIKRVADSSADFVQAALGDLEFPATAFEQKFRDQTIYRLILRRA